MPGISQTVTGQAPSNCMFDLAVVSSGRTKLLTHIRLLSNSPGPSQAGAITALGRPGWAVLCTDQAIGLGGLVNPVIVVERIYNTQATGLLRYDRTSNSISVMSYVRPPLAPPVAQVQTALISLYGSPHTVQCDGTVGWAVGSQAHPDALGTVFPLTEDLSSSPDNYGVLSAVIPGEQYAWCRLSRVISGPGGCL